MTAKLLQMDFKSSGPWGAEMVTVYKELAYTIAQVPGLRWKIWTENQSTGEGGGIYLFDDEASLQAYAEEHTARLKSFGIQEIRAKQFDVSEELTIITRGPIR